MDYKKLVKDLLLGCQENCENCEYSDLIEFNCTMGKVAADAILELLIENKVVDKKNSDLQVRAESTESVEAHCNMLEKMVKEYQEVIIPRCVKRIEQVKQERDAAISDLKRAEKNVKEAYMLLDREIQPVFDYSVYTAIHDSVSDIVDWEKDSIWRKKKE